MADGDGAVCLVSSCKSSNGPSLQESFMRFKKDREKFLSDERFHADVPRTPEQKERIRQKFLERAMSYQGVPYAKRYHEPGTQHYDAPLFLDCCALVRKAVNDLKHDFGFTLGRWNQAYQADTLPDTGMKSHEELRPGDLIFYSGTYFNEKSRRQKHDMVHVEIYVGPGERSLGARWQKGVVTVFDSFKFESKAYHSVQHHFRSIDRWLSGECSSSPWESESDSLGDRPARRVRVPCACARTGVRRGLRMGAPSASPRDIPFEASTAPAVPRPPSSASEPPAHPCSICGEHPWRRKVFDVSKKSIFYAGIAAADGAGAAPAAADQGYSDEEGEDEAASDGEAPDGSA
eukprot:tig00000157_g9725.t1